MLRDLRIIRLARDRVRLTQHLLRDKIQLPTRMLPRPASLLKRIQMARQPLDLLADVRAFGVVGTRSGKI